MIDLEKYILVIGPSENDFLTAVQQMAGIYADTEFVNNIQTYKSSDKDNQFLVNFTGSPDIERFKYFVNYLNYPEIKNYSAKVMGFGTIAENDKLPKDKLGKRVLLYVSGKDTEGDNVYAIFNGENETYKLGFAMGEEFSTLKQKEFDFAEPIIKDTEYNSLKSISPDPNAKKASGTGTGCMVTIIFLIVAGIGLGLVLI